MGKQIKKTNVDGMIGISQRFAVLNRLITRDLNNNTSAPTFSLYSKDNITEYLTNPYTYEKQLRKAVHTFMAQVLISAGSSSISLVFRISHTLSPHTALTQRA